MNVLDLSRWQFGITTVYHFLFVPVTIGLGFLVAGFETASLRMLAAGRAGREGIAFAANAVAIVAATAALFTALYPDVLRSSISAAYTLTTANASSTARTLAVMSVVAAIFLPFVLLYQAWTYWLFRKRIGTSPARPAEPTPTRAGV